MRQSRAGRDDIDVLGFRLQPHSSRRTIGEGCHAAKETGRSAGAPGRQFTDDAVLGPAVEHPDMAHARGQHLGEDRGRRIVSGVHHWRRRLRRWRHDSILTKAREVGVEQRRIQCGARHAATRKCGERSATGRDGAPAFFIQFRQREAVRIHLAREKEGPQRAQRVDTAVCGRRRGLGFELPQPRVIRDQAGCHSRTSASTGRIRASRGAAGDRGGTSGPACRTARESIERRRPPAGSRVSSRDREPSPSARNPERAR